MFGYISYIGLIYELNMGKWQEVQIIDRLLTAGLTTGGLILIILYVQMHGLCYRDTGPNLDPRTVLC